MPPPPTRRSFLRKAVNAGYAAAAGAVGYGFWEPRHIRVRQLTVPVPQLPPAFAGTTVGVLTDFHHGAFVGIDFIRGAVELAKGLKADAYALVGDFAHKGTHTMRQLPACLDAVEDLRAPLGVYAVPGNHDMQAAGSVYRAAVAGRPFADLTNRAVEVTRGEASLWFAGVDDLWWGKPDLEAALKPVPTGAATVLLAHNPDYAEQVPDPRVSLMLSGHTHGGQVYLPVAGSPWVPSRYGRKYAGGLVQGPASRVFVSRGLGEAGVPLRLNCPPEINLLTLVPADRA